MAAEGGDTSSVGGSSGRPPGSRCRPPLQILAGRAPQIGQQFRRRGVAILWFLGQHFLQDRPEARRHRRIELVHVRRRHFLMFVDALPKTALREWRTAGQHVISGTAQGVNIAPNVRRLAVAGLFGRHVIDGAHGVAIAGDLEIVLVFHVRQTQVGQLDDDLTALPGHQEIGGFDVAVDNPLLKSVVQSLGCLKENAPALSPAGVVPCARCRRPGQCCRCTPEPDNANPVRRRSRTRTG